ncbi:hypothetical protein VTJ04DRAFT_1712 [Mycothermus thermophilus]|uniref:uncharacterized protein n=1 Tax=Humicola insolens TaxID=85995 RepID=UPI003743A004
MSSRREEGGGLGPELYATLPLASRNMATNKTRSYAMLCQRRTGWEEDKLGSKHGSSALHMVTSSEQRAAQTLFGSTVTT